VLERELERKDQEDQENGYTLYLLSRKDNLQARREGDARPRQEILSDIRKKLAEYDEALIKARDRAAIQKPSERYYSSVTHWFISEQSFIGEEQLFNTSKAPENGHGRYRESFCFGTKRYNEREGDIAAVPELSGSVLGSSIEMQRFVG